MPGPIKRQSGQRRHKPSSLQKAGALTLDYQLGEKKEAAIVPESIAPEDLWFVS